MVFHCCDGFTLVSTGAIDQYVARAEILIHLLMDSLEGFLIQYIDLIGFCGIAGFGKFIGDFLYF